MYQSDQFNSLIKQAMAGLGLSEEREDKYPGKRREAIKPASLTPSQVLIIGGLLGGALEVTSILIDKDQTIEIVLAGSLKRKTDLEKMLDQIGDIPFDEVVSAILARLK